MNRAFLAAGALVALAPWAGAGAMRALLTHAPATARVGLAQPMPVVTAWGAFGAWCFAVLALTTAVSALALLTALRTAPPDGFARTRWFVPAVTACALAGAAAWPCAFSSDAYAYAAYGAEAARGLDPYRPVPAAAVGATLDAARFQWNGAFPVCVYGPAFVAFARIVWEAVGRFGAGPPLALLRAAAGLAFLGSIPLASAALADLPPRRRLALLCAYAWQPVSIWAAAEGHNDTFVLLGAAAAAAVARRGFPFAAGVLVGLTAALKAPGALLAAAYGMDAAAVRRLPAGAFGAAGGLVLAALIAVPPLLPALAQTGGHGRYAPQTSLQAAVGLFPALALAAAAFVTGAFRIRGGRRDGFSWLGIAAFAALPNVYPWYALWLVPLALAAWPSGPALALYGVTICAVVRYLPDAAGTMSPDAARAATLAALFPLVLACPGVVPFAVRRQKAAATP